MSALHFDATFCIGQPSNTYSKYHNTGDDDGDDNDEDEDEEKDD